MALAKLPVIFVIILDAPIEFAWFLPSPDFPSYIGLGTRGIDFRARPTLLEEPVVTFRALPPILGGTGEPRSVSAIRIGWEHGDDDGILATDWRSKYVEVHAALPSSTDASATVTLGVSTTMLFQGPLRDLTWTPEILTLTVDDSIAALNVPLTTAKYAGTGDEEGDSELEDVLKPVMIGTAVQAEAVLVEASTQLYQYHDGDATGVLNVYDGGVLVPAATGTFSTVAALLAWSAVPGEVAEAPAVGMFRMGSVPSSVVTVTASGDADCPLDAGGTGNVVEFVDLIGAILEKYGGIASSAIDLSGVPDVGVVRGFYSGRSQVSILDAVRVVVETAGVLALTVDEEGVYQFVLIDRPATPSTADLIREAQIISIARSSSLPLPGGLRIGYARSWTTLSGGQILPGAATAHRRALESPFQFAEYDYAADAPVFDLATFVANRSQADSIESLYVSPWLETGFDPLLLTVRDIPSDWMVGTEVRIDAPRFTASDRGWRIVGMSRQISQGFGTIEVIG